MQWFQDPLRTADGPPVVLWSPVQLLPVHLGVPQSLKHAPGCLTDPCTMSFE